MSMITKKQITLISLLGQKVMPLLRKGRISGSESDRRNGGMGESLQGEARRRHYRKTISAYEKELLKDNKEQEWFVGSIHHDGTFTLNSELGYTQAGMDRSDFRVIKL